MLDEYYLSLKNQRFTPSDCKDIRVRKCKFVAKTQFLCNFCLKSVEKILPLNIIKVVNESLIKSQLECGILA